MNLERARREFLIRLAQMKHEAGELSMWKTMQALDNATRVSGFELADLLTGEQADTAPTVKTVLVFQDEEITLS